MLLVSVLSGILFFVIAFATTYWILLWVTQEEDAVFCEIGSHTNVICQCFPDWTKLCGVNLPFCVLVLSPSPLVPCSLSLLQLVTNYDRMDIANSLGSYYFCGYFKLSRWNIIYESVISTIIYGKNVTYWISKIVEQGIFLI